jgi:hypothetical protein
VVGGKGRFITPQKRQFVERCRSWSETVEVLLRTKGLLLVLLREEGDLCNGAEAGVKEVRYM